MREQAVTDAKPDDRHLPALDGLRGLAALAVVLSHLPRFGLETIGGKELGHYGVIIFFVLSGFLMGHLYLQKRFEPVGVARYAAARVARIVPIYYATIIASFVIYQWFDPNFFFKIAPYDLLRLFLFVGNVSIFWSIGPEFQFYVLFLLLWWAIDQPEPRRTQLLVGLGAAMLLLLFVQSRIPGIVVFAKLHVFLLGVGGALLRHHVAARLTDPRLVFALQAAAVVFLVLLLPRGVFGEVFYSYVSPDVEQNVYYGDLRRLAPIALTVFALSLSSGWTRLVFANAAMRGLGNASFSIYLLHVPVIFWMGRAGVFAATGPVVGAFVALAAVFAVGTASFMLFERPAQNLLRGPLANWFARRFAALPGIRSAPAAGR